MWRRIRGRTRFSKSGSARIRKAWYRPAMGALRCHPVIAHAVNVGARVARRHGWCSARPCGSWSTSPMACSQWASL